MRTLRIVFMGTSDFAVPTLHALIENHYDVAGIVTAPDKPAGRGQKMQPSAVKKYAGSKNIKVLQPTHLKNEKFMEELKSLKANLQIVVAFRMLPRAVWELPEYGTFNLHASLLPDYRGAAPINWVLINGENKTGVTTFFIDERIDTGKILLQDEVGISSATTAGELHDELMNVGAALVLKTVELIKKDKVHPIMQPESKNLKTAPKIDKNTCKIYWDETVDAIYNRIRGLSPYPTAWAILKNNQEEIPIKIYSAEKETATHSYKNGHLLHHKKQLKVAVKNGFIHLKEIQLPGKRKMDIKSVLNGFELASDAKML